MKKLVARVILGWFVTGLLYIPYTSFCSSLHRPPTFLGFLLFIVLLSIVSIAWWLFFKTMMWAVDNFR